MKRCARCKMKLDEDNPTGWHDEELCVFCEYALEEGMDQDLKE